jgi:SAM-dependent methyltransferase
MTTITPPAPGGYNELAPFYDAFAAASDYEAWTTRILALLDAYTWRGTRVLDVACGTGNSFLPLMRRGLLVTGCDLSPAMLEEAARKAPGVALIEADMRQLPQLGEFDLVTCFDDSLNHVLDEQELCSALRSMAANLAEDGLLLFDLNTLLAYRTTFARASAAERDGSLFLWRGDSSADAAPGCRATAHIDVFTPDRDHLYTRVSTAHEQCHHAPHRAVALLARAGLECLGVHGVLDDGSPVDDLDETSQLKALYVARLAKGGDPE